MKTTNKSLITLNRTLTAVNASGTVFHIKSFLGEYKGRPSGPKSRVNVIYNVEVIIDDTNLVLSESITLEFSEKAIAASQDFNTGNPKQAATVAALLGNKPAAQTTHQMFGDYQNLGERGNPDLLP